MAKKGLEILGKQGPVTYEQALAQVQALKKNSKVTQRKLYKSVTEIPGILESNPLKLTAEHRGKFRKFDIFNIDLRLNNLPVLRRNWRDALMRKWVEIDNKIWYVHAIEACALAEECEHSSVGLVVLEDSKNYYNGKSREKNKKIKGENS